LKLSLGLLFGISNILSLGWGNYRTYLSEKLKKNEKCKFSWVYTQKEIEKRKKKPKPKTIKNFGLLKKRFISVKNNLTLIVCLELSQIYSKIHSCDDWSGEMS